MAAAACCLKKPAAPAAAEALTVIRLARVKQSRCRRQGIGGDCGAWSGSGGDRGEGWFEVSRRQHAVSLLPPHVAACE